jgi:hypothetical protein
MTATHPIHALFALVALRRKTLPPHKSRVTRAEHALSSVVRRALPELHIYQLYARVHDSSSTLFDSGVWRCYSSVFLLAPPLNTCIYPKFGTLLLLDVGLCFRFSSQYLRSRYRPGARVRSSRYDSSSHIALFLLLPTYHLLTVQMFSFVQSIRVVGGAVEMY